MKKAKAKIVREVLEPEAAPAPVANYGARLSTAKMCQFCKHPYVKPCNDKTKESCPNFKHLQSRRTR